MTTQEPQKNVTTKICPRCSRVFGATDSVTICPHDQTLLSLVVADPLIGKVVGGHYVVTEVLGQGGWSVVYRAQHETIKNRHVAIKILHAHLVRDKEKVLRFQREAEAAMSLTHANVAAVFDYGILPEGQPFIVMEYLQGTSLDEVIHEEGKLPLERVLNIAAQVCEGLSGAHENRVVHRDVKPSNIFLMKDAKGHESVKVLDFGLAKILSDDESSPNLTNTGDTMGTPDYMSPEQCLGMALDQRSDVYNFGYVLYEMLTGRKAVTGINTFESMNRHIYEYPPPFKEVDSNCPISEAVEAVVFKALNKNRDERYQTTLELRDALLKAASEKEQAVASFQRLLSSVRRKRSSTVVRPGVKHPPDILMVSLSVAVILFLVASTLKISDILNQKHNGAIVTAPANALGQWNTYHTQGINRYNDGDFKGARQSLEQAVTFGAIVGNESDQHKVSLNYLKDTYRKLGDIRAAARIDAKLAEIDKNAAYKDFGRKDENEAKIRKLFRDLLSRPDDKKIATELCATLNNQGALLVSDGRVAEARELVEQAMEICSRLLGKDDAEYGRCLSNMAAINFDSGKRDEAEVLYKRALSVREKALGPDSRWVARSCRNLAEYYRRIGRPDLSIPLLERALKVYKKTSGDQSEDYAFSANNLGIAYLSLGKWDSADEWLNVAAKIRAKTDGVDSVDYARVICNLGNLNGRRKNYTLAERYIKQALDIFERKLGPNKPDYGLAALNLGQVYADTNQPLLGEKYLKRGFAVMHSIEPRSDRTVAAFQELCAFYMKQNKIEEARELTRQVGTISESETKAAEAARPIDMR